MTTMKPTAILTALLLAACVAPVPAPAPAPEPGPGPDACGAASLQSLVGQTEGALAGMTFPNSTRFIYPDTVVTMDYSAERLNIVFDPTGRIVQVRCG